MEFHLVGPPRRYVADFITFSFWAGWSFFCIRRVSHSGSLPTPLFSSRWSSVLTSCRPSANWPTGRFVRMASWLQLTSSLLYSSTLQPSFQRRIALRISAVRHSLVHDDLWVHTLDVTTCSPTFLNAKVEGVNTSPSPHSL